MKALALIAVALPRASVAQRPAQPIRRPIPPGGSNVPLGPGRFRPQTTGGVAGSAASPGVFRVTAVRARDNIVRLSDGDGRSADVYVDSDVFDVSTLEEGDEVAVDFLVPNEGDERLEAGSMWKLEPHRP